jgi:hypothetical protein
MKSLDRLERAYLDVMQTIAELRERAPRRTIVRGVLR